MIGVLLFGSHQTLTQEESVKVPARLVSCVVGMTALWGMGSHEALQADPLAELSATYATPEAVARFLQTQVRYHHDRQLFGRNEYWQTPEELLARKAGDCEDYALLAVELLRRQGIEAQVVSVFGEGYAHTVCVFRDGGRYHLINLGELVRLNARTLEEVASYLNPSWTLAGVMDQLGTIGQLRTELVNAHPSPRATSARQGGFITASSF